METQLKTSLIRVINFLRLVCRRLKGKPFSPLVNYYLKLTALLSSMKNRKKWRICTRRLMSKRLDLLYFTPGRFRPVAPKSKALDLLLHFGN